MPNAGLEPLYWIIYEVWISFTFVNSTDLPNGIISIEPIYKDYIEREWKSANWDISIYEDNSTDKPVSLPIELPPKTPRKFYFRAIHFAGITPERGVDPVITYGNTLSPLTWTFNIVNSEEVTHTSDLYISDGEAANDGIYKFADDCISILPEWGRLSIPGRAIP